MQLYYRQKGQRQTTRPQAISEYFEACAETLIRRLRKYKQQTEVYHNSCIQGIYLSSRNSVSGNY